MQKTGAGLDHVFTEFAGRFKKRYKRRDPVVSLQHYPAKARPYTQVYYQASMLSYSRLHVALWTQAVNLRRLLEMYERWQHMLMPTMGFDDFLAGVENLGKTNQVKAGLLSCPMLL